MTAHVEKSGKTTLIANGRCPAEPSAFVIFRAEAGYCDARIVWGNLPTVAFAGLLRVGLDSVPAM
jgi:hypothetical protein